MVRVPTIVPEVPALRRDPVVASMVDQFTRPQPFQPDVIVDISAVLPRLVALLDCHASQVYEWIPHVEQIPAPVPSESDRAARLEWLTNFVRRLPRHNARRFGATAEYVEAFEISEYARRPTDAERAKLFLQ
jgi:LmbE family N-acetylglucosaminyl deacetylase